FYVVDAQTRALLWMSSYSDDAGTDIATTPTTTVTAIPTPAFTPVVSSDFCGPISYPATPPALYVVNIDGSDLRRLTFKASDDFQLFGAAAWSPDGRYLAIAAYSRTAENSSGMYIVSAD